MAIETVRTFPNLEGKHLRLKFTCLSTDSTLELYHARYKLFKTRDRVNSDAVHPNLGLGGGSSCYHLTLKLTHAAEADFIAAYASMGLLGKKE
jgi:hypothetical protein